MWETRLHFLTHAHTHAHTLVHTHTGYFGQRIAIQWQHLVWNWPRKAQSRKGSVDIPLIITAFYSRNRFLLSSSLSPSFYPFPSLPIYLSLSLPFSRTRFLWISCQMSNFPNCNNPTSFISIYSFTATPLVLTWLPLCLESQSLPEARHLRPLVSRRKSLQS